ncbi:MAG: hypothetical protein U7123_14260 [Potamolinea sp.]
MIQNYKLLLTTSAVTLALFSIASTESVQGATITNPNTVGVSRIVKNQQPILVSVVSNWQAKLPSVKNKIISTIEAQLKPLAKGNQGYARVEALRIEGANLYVKVLIHHKHEPSKKWGIPQGIPYSLQTWIETRYNPLDSKQAMDNTKLCVRGPSVIGSPNMCTTAAQIRQAINAFL